MAEYGTSEVIRPSGPLSLSPDGDVGSGTFEQVEGELSERGQVFRAVVLAVAGTILVKGDVQHTQCRPFSMVQWDRTAAR